jgi:hypothetical protein
VPRNHVDRLTASATYHRAFDGNGIWATTLAYGLNSAREIIPGDAFDAVTYAALLESSVTMHERHTWFGRAEIVEKPAHDLHAHEFAASIFTLGKLQAGYVRQFKPWKGLEPGIGGTITASFVLAELASRYEGRVAPSFGVFLTVKPARHVIGRRPPATASPGPSAGRGSSCTAGRRPKTPCRRPLRSTSPSSTPRRS